jgi:molybdopterin molybdotransferase
VVDAVQDLLAPQAARDVLLARLRRLPAERVPLAPELAGRVLAEPVLAVRDLPPFPNSAMDGYALRAVDAASSPPVAFRIAAGDDPPDLPAGAAAEIATGAPLPDGADAVVPVELAREQDGRLEVDGSVSEGDHVRLPGEDAHAGDVVLDAGTRLTALAIAGAATAGVDAVVAVRRPRVAVVVTGDEIVPPGQPLRRGQIHDSNSLLIAARCASLGADVVLRERVPDDAAATRAALARGFEAADLVLTSGGVSVGPHDHVKPALAALGAEALFWRISAQPGKPVFAGIRAGRPVVGLPGNPLSVLVGLELLVRPALALLSGRAPDAEVRRVRLSRPVRRNAIRTRYLPVTLDGDEASPLGAGLSHLLAASALADALIVIPPGDGEADGEVDALPF